MELLLGCGNSRKKQLYLDGNPLWTQLVTLDIDPECNPDVVFNLDYLQANTRKLPFPDNHFDEIHAYNVLEHIGSQGDYLGFFYEFTEYHRILKPTGTFHIIVPNFRSTWAFGDPGHTRVLTPETFAFLDQNMYNGVGKTSVTDYRRLWKGDLKIIGLKEDENHHYIILQKG